MDIPGFVGISSRGETSNWTIAFPLVRLENHMTQFVKIVLIPYNSFPVNVPGLVKKIQPDLKLFWDSMAFGIRSPSARMMSSIVIYCGVPSMVTPGSGNLSASISGFSIRFVT